MHIIIINADCNFVYPSVHMYGSLTTLGKITVNYILGFNIIIT